ncbi:MAG: hypothetical protein A2537_02755 [Candidatus Magasanikbacteria bacterium RIFOXYD2_FULL_36_9]|uniref:Uncharacterized protein n=1 Tax=Candidatus Magasanikbacteria bacterium RIFOXYD2_FULL_36_9 TaxID=1798707 RepID=A0A1F6P0P4_9BACT|nr:MAG: hypothetical protein A2537_02755 [Candidatus Magasanikbacteria bacterium RIFOXYD2_FULL_36_9]
MAEGSKGSFGDRIRNIPFVREAAAFIAGSAIVGGAAHHEGVKSGEVSGYSAGEEAGLNAGKKIAAEKAASEKKEQDIVAEQKEKEGQDILAKAYNSQFSQAKLKLELSFIDDPVEIQEMNKKNLKQLAKEIVGNSSKWLKYPDTYSGYLLADLSDNFTKEEIREMAKNIPDFFQLVTGQIAQRLEALRKFKSAQRIEVKQGHTFSPDEIKSDEEYIGNLTADIIKMQNLL